MNFPGRGRSISRAPEEGAEDSMGRERTKAGERGRA